MEDILKVTEKDEVIKVKEFGLNEIAARNIALQLAHGDYEYIGNQTHTHCNQKYCEVTTLIKIKLTCGIILEIQQTKERKNDLFKG